MNLHQALHCHFLALESFFWVRTFVESHLYFEYLCFLTTLTGKYSYFLYISSMLYEVFLAHIRDLYIAENPQTSWEEIQASPMWQYMISCFSEHIL